MDAEIRWVTPNAEQELLYIARVSNPRMQESGDVRLIRYCLRNRHWSPFDMVNSCLGIDAPRDVTRQLIRHWSMRVQEFSQRYADPTETLGLHIREARMDDPSNRQKSLPCEDSQLAQWWHVAQIEHANSAFNLYQQARKRGIAREVARVVLPEGNVMSRIYMNGTLRSWIHLLDVRSDAGGAQKETIIIADKCRSLLMPHFPATAEALEWTM